jgi:hypothetical protein
MSPTIEQLAAPEAIHKPGAIAVLLDVLRERNHPMAESDPMSTVIDGQTIRAASYLELWLDDNTARYGGQAHQMTAWLMQAIPQQEFERIAWRALMLIYDESKWPLIGDLSKTAPIALTTRQLVEAIDRAIDLGHNPPIDLRGHITTVSDSIDNHHGHRYYRADTVARAAIALAQLVSIAENWERRDSFGACLGHVATMLGSYRSKVLRLAMPLPRLIGLLDAKPT